MTLPIGLQRHIDACGRIQTYTYHNSMLWASISWATQGIYLKIGGGQRCRSPVLLTPNGFQDRVSRRTNLSSKMEP